MSKAEERRVKLGTASVDSGQLLIIDPAYLREKRVFTEAGLRKRSAR
jgi:hypothetical protein